MQIKPPQQEQIKPRKKKLGNFGDKIKMFGKKAASKIKEIDKKCDIALGVP